MWAQNGTHANSERCFVPGAPGFRKDARHMPRSRDPPSCCDPSSPRVTLAWVPFCAQKPNRRSAQHRLARCRVPGRYAPNGEWEQMFHVKRPVDLVGAPGCWRRSRSQCGCGVPGGGGLRRCDAVIDSLPLSLARRLALRATRDRRVARCAAPKASASPKGKSPATHPRTPHPAPRTFL